MSDYDRQDVMTPFLKRAAAALLLSASVVAQAARDAEVESVQMPAWLQRDGQRTALGAYVGGLPDRNEARALAETLRAQLGLASTSISTQ